MLECLRALEPRHNCSGSDGHCDLAAARLEELSPMPPRAKRGAAAAETAETGPAVSRAASTRQTRLSKRTVFNFIDLPKELKQSIIELASIDYHAQRAFRHPHEPLFEIDFDNATLKRLRLVNKEIRDFAAPVFWREAGDFVNTPDNEDANLAVLRRFDEEVLPSHSRHVKVLRLQQNVRRTVSAHTVQSVMAMDLRDADGPEARSNLLSKFLLSIDSLETLEIDVLEKEGVPFPYDFDEKSQPASLIDYRSSIRRHIIKHTNLAYLELAGVGSVVTGRVTLHQPMVAHIVKQLPLLIRLKITHCSNADRDDELPAVVADLSHLKVLELVWCPLTRKWAGIRFKSPLACLRLLFVAACSPTVPLECIERLVQASSDSLEHLDIDIRSFRSGTYVGPAYTATGSATQVDLPAMRLPNLRSLRLWHVVEDAGAGLSIAVMDRFALSPIFSLSFQFSLFSPASISRLVKSRRFPLKHLRWTPYADDDLERLLEVLDEHQIEFYQPGMCGNPRPDTAHISEDWG